MSISLRSELRARAKIIRAEVKSEEKEQAIAARFLSSDFLKFTRFFVYLSFGSEVNTAPIIQGLLERGKKVCCPKVQKKEMIAVPYEGELTAGAYGILQPQGEEDTPCEVALVPLLAADKSGARLGYGGGYYDRYFEKHKNLVRVGVCFEEQIIEKVPTKEWDMKMDYLLTPSGIFRV